MTQAEYEERKRRLDEQLEAGIELMRTAHRQQLRALDLIWMTTAEGDVALPRLAGGASDVPPPPSAPAVAAAPPPPHRTAVQLVDDIMKIFSSLPEVFDRNDVCLALGEEPDRGSLYRALQYLRDDKLIATERPGMGRVPSRYKKLRRGTPEATG